MTDIRMGARWCRKEDEELAELAVDLNHNWVEIAQNFEKRSAKMCENRWNQVISLGLIKGKWSIEEDNIIIESMNHGILKWSEIAKRLPGNRVGKQCRERWCNHLDPSLKKTPWTAEEDSIMFREQKKIGNSWTKIAMQIPGRSENEVKNRFNSTIRKRKLAESNGKSCFNGPSYTSDEDQNCQNEYEGHENQYNIESSTPSRSVSKRMRHTIEPQVFRSSFPKYPCRSYPTIPQGYSIISLSKDDIRALNIAERLLKRLVFLDSPISPRYVSQLMSLLSMTQATDTTSTFASLNMVHITNIADHEPPTSSSGITSLASSENEGPEADHSERLRIDTGRCFGSTDPSSFHRLKNKKINTILKRTASETCLWAPAEDQSESQRIVSASTASVGSAQSSLKLYYQDTSHGGSPQRGLGEDLDRKYIDGTSASLPVYEDEVRDTSIWQNVDNVNFGKIDSNSSILEEDGDVDGDGGDCTELTGREKEITERSGSQCSSPFSLFEELTCSSPSWDCFSPVYTPNMTAPPSANHSPVLQIGIPQGGRGPHKKRKFLPLNDPNAPKFDTTPRERSPDSSVSDHKRARSVSRSSSSSCLNNRGSLEDDIVVEALRMLSGRSRSLHKGHRSGGSSISGGYDYFNPSDSCDTDYMSSFSLSDTPLSSRNQSPTRMMLDDPTLLLPGQMDGLRMNSSYFSLTNAPWSRRVELSSDDSSPGASELRARELRQEEEGEEGEEREGEGEGEGEAEGEGEKGEGEEEISYEMQKTIDTVTTVEESLSENN